MTQRIRIPEQAMGDLLMPISISLRYNVLMADLGSITDQRGGDTVYIIDTGQTATWDAVHSVWAWNP